jgi:hypothetical protein
VGPRAVLDAVVKRKIPSPCRESNPRTPIVKSVAQRYTGSSVLQETNIISFLFVIKFSLYERNDVTGRMFLCIICRYAAT